MKITLSRIEARLQTLVEGSAAKIFPSRRRPDHLAARLIESMHSGASTIPSGAILAPNLYTIEMNPAQVSLLKDNPDLIESLAQSLREAGTEAGFEFPSPPVVRVAASPDIPTGELRVLARNSHQGLAATSDLAVEFDGEAGYLPPNAFLIVDGTRIYSLELPVVNIGRRPDNQLVIEDARVSRVHAQLRVVRHRFVIFDLDSSGGTFVNGESVSQQPLYPGDVISLAGVPLVYGQDSTAPNDTQTIQPGASPPSTG